MELHELVQHYVGTPEVSALTHMLTDANLRVSHLDGARASAAAVLFATLARTSQAAGKLLLFVLDDEESAGYFYHDLVQLAPPLTLNTAEPRKNKSHAPNQTTDGVTDPLRNERILYFPSSFRHEVKFGRRDAAAEILRTEVLGRLAAPLPPDGPLYVVSYPEALAEKVTPPDTLQHHMVHLATGESHRLTQLEERLQELGFNRTDYVYEPGEYSIRGSIVDIYSYTGEEPFRIDFFGDTIESIRTFEVDTQLSGQTLNEIDIAPDMAGIASPKTDFAKVLPPDTVWVFHDFTLAISRATLVAHQGFSAQEAEVNEPQLDAGEWLTPADDIERQWSQPRRIETGAQCSSAKAPDAVCHISIEPQPLFHKNFDLMRTYLRRYLDEGLQLYILSDSAKQQERLHDIFEEKGDHFPFTAIRPTLHEGFIDRTRRCCFLTDHQIFDRFHRYSLRGLDRAHAGKIALSLRDMLEFKPGDYVVHVDHGIGRFTGLVRMPSGPTGSGQTQEMMKLTYHGGDVVLVSIHSLHKVSKYKSQDGEAPALSHLGTGAWQKLKSRTKKKIKDIARDLIKLYAQRLEQPGFSYSPDTYLQHELEASFPYEDTPDQLRVTQEVKADMERPQPMDRLVCGDVGFGKTEIAIRVAFKAATDGKQTAVMVPTTVLALQHFHTFQRRLKDFPVRVDYLSRARTPAQTRQVLADLREGRIDILIGTHKLAISRSVQFHDLGLLIIDEEQKFGVAVKERIRQLRANIDTLTLSATPIPRTLQFSLMGARDFSLLQTPPEGRRPIQTEVHAFNPEVLTEAIRTELDRGGQAFVVAPRIASLPGLAEIIRQSLPEARIAIAHGQMPPADLERTVVGFVNNDSDVLLCTTIVENGVDIPNANTIVIIDAHRFGLADLHQMRGRVGRSSRRAFCYLLAPPMAGLPTEARRRLEALESFSHLGSGLHIAMQDLDIRGAGNLLGAEQSGFIADLGYETYRKILTEAVCELKNSPEFAALYAPDTASHNQVTPQEWVTECSIECDLRAYLPETYVPGSGERIALYRELDNLSTPDQVKAFSHRLSDRFGPLPPEAAELLRVVELRRMARQLGVERIVLKGGRMTLYFVSQPSSPFYDSATFSHVITYAMSHVRQCALNETDDHHRSMRLTSIDSIKSAVNTLHAILHPETPQSAAGNGAKRGK